MTIEQAVARAVAKPWGRRDRQPWSSVEPGAVIGEIWFERPGLPAAEPSLLLKLLFTQQPLSIQVHPDDAMAHRLGLPRGKSEAWYVLSAAPGAKLARGVTAATTHDALRAAVADGSIANLVHWQDVHAGDAVAVAAGTIHALGADLVVAELQQRSDTTFRVFDFGRGRALQVDQAIAAADCRPTAETPPPRRLTDKRVLLVACPQFVFERIELPAGSRCEIAAVAETWLLVIDGAAAIGPVRATVGDAVFLERDRAQVIAGAAGMTALVGILAAAPFDGFLTDAPFSSSTKVHA